MFTVRCPSCQHDQLCSPRGLPSGKRRRCVYCGKSFAIHQNLRDSRIVCEGKNPAFNRSLF